MITIVPDEFDIVAFYGYPSYQSCIINDYDENHDVGNKGIRRFFSEVIKRVEKETNKHLMDNKIVFKLRHKRTGTIIYCGYKDNHYKLSLAVFSESSLIINFNESHV